jgi:hypothetical protein
MEKGAKLILGLLKKVQVCTNPQKSTNLSAFLQDHLEINDTIEKSDVDLPSGSVVGATGGHFLEAHGGSWRGWCVIVLIA